MNFNDPLSLPVFNGRATSALSRLPSPFQAFPGGNIGYANRIEGVGDISFGWLTGDADTGNETFDRLINGVTERVIKVGEDALDRLIDRGNREVMEAQGYTFYGPVEVTVNGSKKSGIKATKPNGNWVVVFDDGTEVAYTTDVQKTAVDIDPKTGLSTGAVVGIAGGAVALIALLFFLSSKKR